MSKSRRNLLKAIGGTASMTGIATLVSGISHTVDIPFLRDPHGVYEWKTVPEAWNEHRLYVKSVKEEVDERFLNHPGVAQIGIEGSDETIGEQKKMEIKIKTRPDQETPGIPDKVLYKHV